MNQRDSNFNRFYRIWWIVQSLISVMGLSYALVSGNTLLWFLCILASFVYYIINIPRYVEFPLVLGYANWITVLRLLIVFGLAFSYGFLENTILFYGFLLVVLMDGIDGFIARKFNQSSEVGEALDMETDAFMVLLLSWIHFESGWIDWWILVPGGLRYFYGLFFFWIDTSVDFPPKRIRSSIAVIFFIALLLPFLYPIELTKTVLFISSSLIIISFSTSIIGALFWKVRHT